MPFTSSYSLKTLKNDFIANASTELVQSQDGDDLSVGLAGGGFAVAYDSTNAFGDGITFYDASGNQIGDHVSLLGSVTKGGIAAFGDGSLLVVWGDGADQFASRYSATGQKIGGDITLPLHNPSIQLSSLGVSVATLPDGGFLRVLNRDVDDVTVERYDASGRLISTTQADTNAEDHSSWRKADVAVLSDGGYVVTFENTLPALVILDSQDDIRATIYNSDGTVRRADFHIFGAEDGDYYTNPQVTALGNGGFAWSANTCPATFQRPTTPVCYCRSADPMAPSSIL